MARFCRPEDERCARGHRFAAALLTKIPSPTEGPPTKAWQRSVRNRARKRERSDMPSRAPKEIVGSVIDVARLAYGRGAAACRGCGAPHGVGSRDPRRVAECVAAPLAVAVRRALDEEPRDRA